jgi:predicted nucleic acid-binding protein
MHENSQRVENKKSIRRSVRHAGEKKKKFIETILSHRERSTVPQNPLETLRHLRGYSDSVYAALAEELEGKWLTLDKKAHGMIKDEKLSVNLYETLPREF